MSSEEIYEIFLSILAHHALHFNLAHMSDHHCILAIGEIKQIPVVKNGAVVPGHVMKGTLSCDHRAVDGAVGAAFLKTFKELLEDPRRMLLH